MEMPSSEDSLVLTGTYGVFHAARLEAGKAPLAAIALGFAVEQTRLEGAHAARAALEKSVVRAEAMRVGSETALEALLGSIDLSVLKASGRKRTAEPYVSTFPKGLTGAIAPRGRAQLAEAQRIANHLAPGAADSPAGVTDALHGEVALLREATLDFGRALDTEEAVSTAVSAAYAQELAARRSWREQYRKDFGLLTALFGVDKRKVESFFKAPGKAKRAKPAP